MRLCNDCRSNILFTIHIFILQRWWKFWSNTCYKGHIKLHWSCWMASSCYLQEFVRNWRWVLSIRWTDLCYEIRVVDVWWISGEFFFEIGTRVFCAVLLLIVWKLGAVYWIHVHCNVNHTNSSPTPQKRFFYFWPAIIWNYLSFFWILILMIKYSCLLSL